MNAILEKWKEKLLDVDKGNKLLNCPKNGARTLSILTPTHSMIFSSLLNEQAMRFYDVDRFIKNYRKENRFSQVENITDEFLTQRLDTSLSASEILAYNDGQDTSKVLSSLYLYAEDVLAEKGINVLFAAFGFIKWEDGDDRDFAFNAPLVLMPVSIVKGGTGFKIKMYGDEITTNPTLIYKLKADYNVTLPTYASSGFEDETIDGYFSRVKTALSKTRFDFYQRTVLGIFSFLKMNMYKDLSDNEDLVLQNKDVKSIIAASENVHSQSVGSFDESPQIAVSEDQIKNVVDADASQLYAIERVRRGESLVLQGPPGTGKSQTITNIIAQFLSEGKKVLFVSEKLAALNVVYGNLKRAGLADFCLELHSSMANKREVLNELYRTLTLNPTHISGEAGEVLDELCLDKSKLDNYCKALHQKVNTINKTPYEIFSANVALCDVKAFEFPIKDIGKKGDLHLKTSLKLFEEYNLATQSVGKNYTAYGWYGYKGKQLNYEANIKLSKKLEGCNEYVLTVGEISSELNQNFNCQIKNLSDYDDYFKFIDGLISADIFQKQFLNSKVISQINGKLKEIISYTDQIEAIQTDLSKDVNEGAFSVDLKGVIDNYKNGYCKFFSRLSKGYFKDRKKVGELLKDKNKRIKYQDALEILNKFDQIYNLKGQIDQNQSQIISLSGEKDIKFDRDSVKKLADITNYLSNKTQYIANIQAFSDKVYAKFVERIKQLYSISSALENQRKAYGEICQLFDAQKVNLNKITLISLQKKCDFWCENVGEIENYVQFRNLLSELDKNDLKTFVDRSIIIGIDPSNLCRIYKKLFYEQWAYKLCENQKVFSSFSKLTHEMAVSDYCKKDKLRLDINKAEIITKLLSSRPSADVVTAGSQVGVLLREVNKKRRQMPVLSLLDEITELIQTLKPCFMMSPLSVSTLLTPESCKFDAVIFDEASQIFPWDAVGAIYRAKQTIVVGDSKQMPPSDFFRADLRGSYNDDDAASFESILDLSASSLPQVYLKWHYRSRCEDLIAFSNKSFYGGKLVTFPASENKKVGVGVDFCYCERGIFNRTTKSNVVEAQRVCDLVFKSFAEHPERSVGVVAFSVTQQEEVIKALAKRREEDPSKEEFFSRALAQPFFVKNLETVQGDERDTIIFSVGYGKDEMGKFYHNFGPLNKDGGERRLNVAVTRAKYNVKLVTSIKYSDIDETKTQAVGAKLLRDYLYFAERGMDGLYIERSGEVGEGYLTEIENTITDAGYTFERNYGCSSYKIDFAVKSGDGSRFIAAVECDGQTYSSSVTTRDRDRLRREVLEKLGWNYYRIWSVDWFKNKAVAKADLVKFLDAKAKGLGVQKVSKAPKEEEHNDFLTIDEKVNESPFDEYIAVETDELVDEYLINGDFESLIYKIVSVEAPIHEEYLLKRILRAFGKDKLTNFVKLDFEERLKSVDSVIMASGFLYCDIHQPICFRTCSSEPRDIKYVHIDEIKDGILGVIKSNVGVEKEDLFRTLAKLMGYARMGDNIYANFSVALELLKIEGKVLEQVGQLFVV